MPKPRQMPGRTNVGTPTLFIQSPGFRGFFHVCPRYSTCVRITGITGMKNQTLKYYMHDGPSAFRFELAGDLNDEGAARLDQDWRTASVVGSRALIVDMTFVTNVDERGRALLGRWYAQGAQ